MRVASLLAAALAAAPVFVQPAASQSPSTPPDGGTRLIGRVATTYAELVAGATVTLVGGPPPTRTWRMTSGPGGAFAFDNIPAGDFVVSAEKTGYTNRALLPTGGFQSGLEVTVAGTGQPADVEIVLRRPGSIAGRIVQPDGTPAPGTQVVPAVRAGDRNVLLFDARTTSAWDGRYEVTGLPPGEYVVAVLPAEAGTAPDSSLPIDVSAAPLKFAPTFYPGVPESEPGQPVAVYEGVATEGVDVWLAPAPQRFSVSGRVFWPEGLELETLVIEYGGSPAVRSGIWYVTDPGGLFSLTGISQGTLVMLARADSSRGPLVGLAATDVLLGSVEDVRLVLGAPGRVTGRLTYDRPLPAGSTPRVTLVHALLQVSPLYPAEAAVADADGRFEIPAAFGTYTIDVHGLPPGWAVSRIRRGGRVLEDRRLLVAQGERITGLDIEVGPGPS